MKLSEWAKKQGITYKTAWRWWKAGQLPVPAIQMASGTVVIQDTTVPVASAAALYARVSSSDQRKDLEAQLGRLAVYASSNGYNVAKTASEIGSGLNGHRPKLMKLLSDQSVTVIIVEHRDRLMRFGAEYVESALAAQGRKIVVMNQEEVKDDLVQDMIEVLTSFCARLYGRRSAKNKAKKAIEAIHE
jgi:predicted site-specific integrase-resolvase